MQDGGGLNKEVLKNPISINDMNGLSFKRNRFSVHDHNVLIIHLINSVRKRVAYRVLKPGLFVC